MAIDPYASCPGGTGKKIKFCCSDLVGELDKIERMLEGEQRVACLEHINSLEGKFPDRACLMSVKAALESSLDQLDKAHATLERYIGKYPGNPVALAELAMQRLGVGEITRAVEALQQALDGCSLELPQQVLQAIATVGQALIAEGRIPAGCAHLQMAAAIAPKNESLLGLLLRIYGSDTLPLILRQDTAMLPCPDDALWKTSFQAAMELALRGRWLAAAERLSELAAKAGDWPAISRNLAILRLRLADEARAVEALRVYAAQDIPVDDAIEAEALAQLLEERTAGERVDMLRVTYDLNDADRAQELLAAHPRAPRMPIAPPPASAEGEPPPRAVYWLLDRPELKQADVIARADVPRIVGQMWLYGKQTDRSARIELTSWRAPELPAAEAAVQEVLRDVLGERRGEETTGAIPVAHHALRWNWILPEGTPHAVQARLSAEERRERLLTVWPQLPLSSFGGRSALEAVADFKLRIRVDAAILILETSGEFAGDEESIGALRDKLGLPRPAAIDPTQVRVAELPVVRLARLDMARLADDELLRALQRAADFRFSLAVRKLALQAITRPSLADRVDAAELHGLLAEQETDSDRAIEHIAQARSADEAKQKSSARWDLAELNIRLERNEPTEVERLFEHLRAEHMREPGVAQALMQLLVSAGVVNPNDVSPAALASMQAGPGAAPAAAAPAASKLWTPDGQSAPAAGKKSAIWTPGMD